MTASVALVAIAASIAEPPARRISTPACEARLCGHATMPRRAKVGGRPVVILIIQTRSACSVPRIRGRHGTGGAVVHGNRIRRRLIAVAHAVIPNDVGD